VPGPTTASGKLGLELGILALEGEEVISLE